MPNLFIKIADYIRENQAARGAKLSVLVSASLFTSACQLPAKVEETSLDEISSVPRPNILFILADDHRWDLIGKYHPIIQTPTLDKLADQGVLFKKAFVTTPICGASRASILTGLTERTSDYSFHRPPVSEEDMAITYPVVLKQHGYKTGFVGKFGVETSGNIEQRFDYFKRSKMKKTDVHNGVERPQTYHFVELAKDFIEQNKDSDQPWSLSVSFWNPHALDPDKVDQYHYPVEFDDYYNNLTIPPAPLSSEEYFGSLPEFLQTSLGRERWQYRYKNEALYQKMVKRHYRAVSAVDRGVGMLYEKLVESGMAENTIIIYTGDNGYSLNNRQLAGKWFGWDEDLRVPLIIFDPRNLKAQERDEIALNIDIAPTILDLAGIELSERYQGKSLKPIMAGEAPEWRSEFFFEHLFSPKVFNIPPTVGVRTEDWKYVRYYRNQHEQLYHLKSDPNEAINLANSKQHQNVLNTLRQKTDAYIDQYEAERNDTVKQRAFDGNKKTNFVNTDSKNY
ncbi:sulfatase [Paraglaciecola aquimarina]|uniref:Sulfatase n=1 Tax=Paraglaciecola aquimarina TaxID=1235557 RepID=A0ABU3SRD0_9ALTE|nr:sulfatase [Paraglaciecola aquimarina]MDU0352554.1 sulfatase [Paraglaciecola aquimarina]